MAGFYTDYWAKKLYENTFGQAAIPALATLYCGVSTSVINRDGTGATEPIGNAYARVSVPNNTTNFPASSGSPPVGHNAIAITFPVATGAWGTILWAAWYDSASGGNMISAGPLATSKTIGNGDTLSFPVTTGFTGSQS